MHDWSADFAALFSLQGLIGLITLSILEIILGIDNIIFISIAVNKLPVSQQKKARTLGLTLALVVRSILLFFIGWIAGLKEAIFHVGDYGVSGKSLILISGGIFLLIKTWQEIIEKIYTDTDEIETKSKGKNTFNAIILQIIIIDFVFSFDSILAAVGVSGIVVIMISAVVISMLLMILFSGLVADFINKNQGIKMIALTFLLVIGGILLAEGLIDCYNFSVPLEKHIELNKNYAYIALGFALLIEMFNMKEKAVKRKKDLGL
ncbi:MAG: TerC family protein [Bacteroidota bacterium]|nr:TerC family protein [Bacteroidota bacterium]MDP3146150.1 TerC family protein [Bacteroidota bacterium]MDP3556697.1 TerC family protein [Bacteroidota bacterium]